MRWLNIPICAALNQPHASRPPTIRDAQKHGAFLFEQGDCLFFLVFAGFVIIAEIIGHLQVPQCVQIDLQYGGHPHSGANRRLGGSCQIVLYILSEIPTRVASCSIVKPSALRRFSARRINSIPITIKICLSNRYERNFIVPKQHFPTKHVSGLQK